MTRGYVFLAYMRSHWKIYLQLFIRRRNFLIVRPRPFLFFGRGEHIGVLLQTLTYQHYQHYTFLSIKPQLPNEYVLLVQQSASVTQRRRQRALALACAFMNTMPKKNYDTAKSYTSTTASNVEMS